MPNVSESLAHTTIYCTRNVHAKHDTGVPEQALGWLPLGLGLVMEDEPSELSCSCTKVWLMISSSVHHTFLQQASKFWCYSTVRTFCVEGIIVYAVGIK